MSTFTALLVGAGGMGQRWARALSGRPDVTLAGWVDIVEESAVAAAARLGLQGVEISTDLEGAIDRLGPDFVVDVTVPDAHFAVTTTSLERRIPVLGEKPMAATMAEARSLVELSERTGKLFMVSQNRRYKRQLAALRRLVEVETGPVEHISCQFFRAPHFGGFRDEMAHPLIEDMAIHHFDNARWLIDADPVAVSCFEANPSWSWYAGAASATAVFEFEGGARVSYDASWCAEGADTSWEGTWRLIGPRGTAIWDGIGPPFADVVSDGGGHRRVDGVVDPMQPEDVDGSLDEFLAALTDGHAPMGECHDNIKSLAMTHAAVQSAVEGRRVAVTWS
ncbi:MAG TPA: Gfo/Idh/MocA family oxidoreductase [Acidimicrobiales bacterium]|nr:Gfo/Idh/MocA family oxidoreductase [Acidimicrobiales bacterium]